jgi:alkylmercury lyase
VRLSVTPEGIKFVEPANTHVSFLTPDVTSFQKDVVSTFCHFVHFFPSREAGDAWVGQHPGTFILSVADAHIIAARKNGAQYSAALR